MWPSGEHPTTYKLKPSERRGTQAECHAGALFRLVPECHPRHNSAFPMSAAQERPFSHHMLSRPSPASKLLLHYSGLIHLPLRFLCLTLCIKPFLPLTTLLLFFFPSTARVFAVYLPTPAYFLSSPSKAYSSLRHPLPPSTLPILLSFRILLLHLFFLLQHFTRDYAVVLRTPPAS